MACIKRSCARECAFRQAYVALVMSESNKNIPDAQVLNHVALRTTVTDIRNSFDVAVSELYGWYF